MKKIGQRLFLVFSFMLTLTLFSPLAQAGPEEDALLGRVTHELNERWEEVFYEFSDLALKKYCPTQYDQIQDTLLQIHQQNRRLSLSDLRSDRDLLLGGSLHRCADAQVVLDLEYAFNEYMALMTADVVGRMEKVLTNSALDLSFDYRQDLVGRLVSASLEQDYQAAKILTVLTATSKGESEIRMDYLAALPGTKVIDRPGAGEEIAQPAKKNRCGVCQKKLGLLPFACRCEGEFCSSHRLPEEHACTFDYHAAGKAQLSKSLPVVSGDKLPEKI